jgi:hypothetical protein
LRICKTSARRLHDVCTTSARRGTTSSTSHLSPFAPFRVIPSLLELYWCHMHSKKQRSIQKEQVVPNHEYSEHGRVPSTRRLHGNRRLHEIYTKSARICINLRGICTNLQVCELDKAGFHMSESPHRLGDCPTATWCGPSLTVLKHPHCGHSHASVTSDVDMERVAVCNRVCCVIFRMSDVQNSGPLWTYFAILGGMEC